MKNHHTAAYDSADLPRLVEFIYRIRKPEDLAEFPNRCGFRGNIGFARCPGIDPFLVG